MTKQVMHGGYIRTMLMGALLNPDIRLRHTSLSPMPYEREPIIWTYFNPKWLEKK